MALLFIDGFDHYATADIGKKWSATSVGSINATGGRRGGGSFRSSSNNGAYVAKTLAASASFVVGMAFKYTALPTFGGNVKIIQIWDGGTSQCDLRVRGDGTLEVTRFGTALTGGASVVSLSINTDYYIEFKVTIANSIAAGSCKVRVNGVDVITVAAGQDTQNSANATANQVRIGTVDATNSLGNVDFDDVYIADLSGSVNNDFLGDVRIDTLYPTSDGNYTAFTPSTGSSHFALVDEATPNTSDYNDGAAVGDRDSYGMGNLSALASQTVYGVQVNAAIMKDDAGSKSAATFVRSSSTNGDGAGVPLGTSQVYISQVFETDPNGSIAWTESSVNAMEAGVKVTA